MKGRDKLKLEVRKLMDELNGFDDPYMAFRYDSALCSVNSASLQEIQKLAGELRRMKMNRLLFSNDSDSERSWPSYPESDSILVGYGVRTGKEIRIPTRELTKHVLLHGGTGTGKTSTIFSFIIQVIRLMIHIIFRCKKNEGRRLVNLKERVLVRSIDGLWSNFLSSVDMGKQYLPSHVQELRRLASIRPESAREVLRIMRQLEVGASEMDGPFPSLMDFVAVLRAEGKKRKKPTVVNSAAALESFLEALEPMSRIRKAPSPETLEKYLIHVQESRGIATPLQQYVFAMQLLRYQSEAYAGAKLGELHTLLVSDEGELEFGKELLSAAGSSYIPPQKKLITQVRSSGLGVLVGIQNLDAVDSTIVNNCGTYIFLGAHERSNLVGAGELLRLPRERFSELSSLKINECFIRSTVCDEPVRLRIPFVDPGSPPSDQELNTLMRGSWEELDRATVFSPRNDFSEQIDLSEILVGYDLGQESDAEADETLVESGKLPGYVEDWMELLRHVLEFPEEGTANRYDELGYSRGKGNRLKKELLTQKLITVERRKSPKGGRPSEVLVLTGLGEKFVETYATWQ